MTVEKREKLLAQLDAMFHPLHYRPTFPNMLLEEWEFDDINIVRAILIDPQPPPGLFTILESIVSDLGSRISYDDFLDYYSLDEVQSIFAKWEKKPSREYYPRTAQHGFFDHLMEYLIQLNSKAFNDDSRRVLDFSIYKLLRTLHSVNDRLVKMLKRRKEDTDVKMFMKGIANLAYEIEYAIDLFLSKDIPNWHIAFWLRDIQRELFGTIEELNRVSGDVDSIISELLEWDSGENKIVPIMIDAKINGKLQNIWEKVKNNFRICAWSLVSSYKESKTDVFLQLLKRASSVYADTTKLINKISIGAEDLSEDELRKSVHNLFNRNWAFIMLKDVNDIEDFEDIKKVLPNAAFSSQRIVVTTKSPELVAYCNSGCQKDLVITKISGDHASTSQHTEPTRVIGFKKETKAMLRVLTDKQKKLCIISVVGMPGQGKTTLVKKLYTHATVVDHFHTKAWVCVSQVYVKKDLFLTLLYQVKLRETIIPTNEQEIHDTLNRTLQGRKFLVVLDDLWDTAAWYDLKTCFPDKENGSRIILTTRQKTLVPEPSPTNLIQDLEQLSDAESWELLEIKVFQKQSCPGELVEVGNKIAKHCKGLPLSVILSAGVLAKIERTKEVWEEIAENLSSHLLDEAKADGSVVIELSYNHLPDWLRPCFLYFGAFLEDQEVPAQKLIRLWIAEGFIQHSVSEKEKKAEDYLSELIDRNLLMVAQQKSKGGVKSCRIHDLLREFALTKASEENFLEPIQGYNGELDSSSESITYHRRRLCIYSTINHFFNLKPLGPSVRSLLFFAAGDMSSGDSYDISFIFRNFKLLRILNFEDINIGNSFNEIAVLLHLRYLAVQGTKVSVPPSISNLWNLETFFVKSLEDEVVEVPDSIWNIENLRHLHIDGRASFQLDPERLENSFVQANLQTLSTPSLAYGDDMEKMLRKLQGIRKLKCNFLDPLDDSSNSNKSPELKFLDKLESLKVFYNGKRPYPCQFNFPSNLKKLTLTNFRMPWSTISQLATLDNLEVLKLLRNAFKGEIWEIEKHVVFQKLKFLKLDSLNVVEWIATDDNFPILERLILHKCEQLTEIPCDISNIPALLMVEVGWCSPSAAKSAIKIQELKLQYCKDFKIVVYSNIESSESSS